jgi:hypothetical protein
MNTLENNKLIAEFMGYETYEMSGYINIHYSDDNVRTINDVHYHSSWDWLMPCIGKISNQCEEPEELDGLKYALLCNDIDTAYEFVIEYINR